MDRNFLKYLSELKVYGVKNNIPNVSEDTGRFLNALVRMKKPKNILEIGCANGYSTIWMAEAAKNVGAKIHAIDKSRPTFEQAKINIPKAGFGDVVEFYFGDAISVINGFSPELMFDFIFVDGEKRSYLDFWKTVESRLKKGGITVFDDMIAFPEKTKNFAKYIETLKGFDKILLPADTDDGILLLVKNN
jgi:predicted O-methyltransferase YrrM